MELQRQAQPNALLRHQRQLRGWSLQQVADQVCKLCEEEDRIPGLTADMVGKWERGEKKPSPFYREKLCLLYETSADKLGFIETLNPPEQQNTSASTPLDTRNNAALYPFVNTISGSSLDAHLFDPLLDGEKEAAEMVVANLLSFSSKQLAALTTAGWTAQDIMAAVEVLLRGETAMAKINRRQVLQFGAGLFLSGIALPTHEHPSAEERTHVSDAIGESIAASWTLFQRSHTAQVLAVGQAQLALVQQAHHTLYPSVRPMHYSGVYRLIGGALHFQGRYDKARQAHEKSYIAALEGGDVWNMAQSLSWQADGYKAQAEYFSASETIESALRLLSQQQTPEAIRLRAHLLASGAENAAYGGNLQDVEAKLSLSENLIKNLPAHEEFDHASWHQHAGVCALIIGQYDRAIGHFEQAMHELPPYWTLRHATTLMPLALAYARKQERDTSLAIAKQAIPVINALNSPSLNKQFIGYIRKEFIDSFPGDLHIRTFVADTEQQLLPTKATATDAQAS